MLMSKMGFVATNRGVHMSMFVRPLTPQCEQGSIKNEMCESVTFYKLYIAFYTTCDINSNLTKFPLPLLALLYVYFYRLQRSCGKVIFSQVSVSHSVHRGGCLADTTPGADTPWVETSLGRHLPLGQTPSLAQCMLGYTQPPSPGGHCSGRYASYSNAFLCINCFPEITFKIFFRVAMWLLFPFEYTLYFYKMSVFRAFQVQIGIEYNIDGNNCPWTLRFPTENITTFWRNIECACEVPVLMRNSVHPLQLVVASRDEAHVKLSGIILIARTSESWVQETFWFHVDNMVLLHEEKFSI